MFPNALEQLSQKHARQKIDLFRAIVAINCSPEAGFFLCSYHLPICAPSFKSRPIRPCRSVCEKVMSDCMATIRKYKGKWPEDVVCKDLPSYDSDVCVTQDSFVNSPAPPTQSSCSCTKQHLNFQFYQQTRYTFVLKMRIKSVSKNGSERIIKGRVHRVLQKGLVDLRKGDTVYLRSNTTCDCPQISRMNADYLVAGHEDVREKRLYLLPATGVVETWERAWVSKFRKWERRFAAKRLLGKKRNRKNRKRQRKAFLSPELGN